MKVAKWNVGIKPNKRGDFIFLMVIFALIAFIALFMIGVYMPIPWLLIAIAYILRGMIVVILIGCFAWLVKQFIGSLYIKKKSE